MQLGRGPPFAVALEAAGVVQLGGDVAPGAAALAGMLDVCQHRLLIGARPSVGLRSAGPSVAGEQSTTARHEASADEDSTSKPLIMPSR